MLGFGKRNVYLSFLTFIRLTFCVAEDGKKEPIFIGCYRYNKAAEELKAYQHSSIPLTADINQCFNHCRHMKRRFAGIIYKNICHCIDKKPNTYDRGGPCFLRCEDNPFQECGGYQKISLLKNQFFSIRHRDLNFGKHCVTNTRHSGNQEWQAIHHPACQTYSVYGCVPEESFKEPAMLIHHKKGVSLYYCIRFCKIGGSLFAVYKDRLCSCINEVKSLTNCYNKTTDATIYKTSYHTNVDIGCYPLRTLTVTKQKDIADIIYLTDCAIYCQHHRFYGYSINASCGCENSFISSAQRFDNLCDVKCKSSPPDRCGGTGVVSVYDTAIKSHEVDLSGVDSEPRKKKSRVLIYSLTPLAVLFFLFVGCILIIDKSENSLL